MKLYILRQNHKVSPFEENLDALPFAETTFSKERERIARKLGVTLETVNPSDPIQDMSFPALLITENCFVSEKALTDF